MFSTSYMERKDFVLYSILNVNYLLQLFVQGDILKLLKKKNELSLVLLSAKCKFTEVNPESLISHSSFNTTKS